MGILQGVFDMFNRLRPLACLVLVCLGGCASVKRMAVGTTSGLLYEATPAIEAESDFTLFRESVLANIKIMEGLLSIAPEDRDLLASLAKAYAGYGFGVYETLDLKDLIQDRSERPWRQRALLFYSRALHYGERYLALEGVDLKTLLTQMRDNKGQDFLDEKLDRTDKRDREVALFSAQALAGMVNFQRDNMMLVSQLPLAKSLFDWGCAYDAQINFGACDLFYGAYHAGRPKMLGGDVELGLKHFEQALRAFPNNYLIHSALLQYYVMPLGEVERYQELKTKLLKARQDFEAAKIWNPLKNSQTEPYALYQAIGLERAQVIIDLEKEWM